MTGVELAGALSGKRIGSGWMAKCPAHGDGDPSLHITETSDGRVLVHCHAGCSQGAVIAALQSLDYWKDDRNGGSEGVSWAIRCRDGTPVAVHHRTDGPDGKRVWWTRPDGSKGLDGRRTSALPLYLAERIDSYDGSELVYITEGEKAADAAVRLGLQAVGTVTGASGCPDAEVLSELRGFKLALWPDHDSSGRTHMAKVSSHLRAIGVEVLGTVDTERLWGGAAEKGQDAADLGALPEDGLPVVVTVEAKVTGPVGREAVAVRLSDVEPEDVAFLWEPYLPAGKLAILEGDPGAGKTWIALAVAATVSSGGTFPGGGSVSPASVLYVTFEDGLADTLRPRLDRLGADCSNIVALSGWRENGEDRGPVTAAEVDLLRREVERLRPALVVVDPIQGYIGAGVNMNQANETRPVLAALSRLAEDSGAVVLVVRHLRKSGADRAAYRGLGSIDFTAAARSVLLAGEDPSNPESRVMAQHKCSVAPKGPSLGFSLDGGEFGWTGESDLTAEALLTPRPGESERSELDEAVEYLRDALADGPVPVKDLEDGAPCSKSTLKRAKRRLGVEARKSDFKGGWEWFLPDSNRPKGTKHTFEPLRDPEQPKPQLAEGDSPRGPSSPAETLGLLRETLVSRPSTEGNGESRETSIPGRPCPRCRSPFCPGCGGGERWRDDV